MTRSHLTNCDRQGTASAVPEAAGKSGVLTPEVNRTAACAIYETTTSSLNAEMPVARAGAPPPQLRAGGWSRVVGCLFAGKPECEAVATRLHFPASPETIWDRILFYEEVPGRPPFLLRVLLPRPVRTEGDKTSVGATVQCTYHRGGLAKLITAVSPPRLVRFAVIEQRLGIEGCVIALSGSYEIRRRGRGAEIVLTTTYRAYLRPRWLWRRLEKLLVGQLHRHILDGMRAAAPQPGPARGPAVAGCLPPVGAPGGSLACTPSPSRFRR
jgi:hypothetical protein